MHALLSHLTNIQISVLLDDDTTIGRAICQQDFNCLFLTRDSVELAYNFIFILGRDKSELVILLEEGPARPNEVAILRRSLKS